MPAPQHLFWSASRTRNARRIVIGLALLAQAGCQSPFRFWRGPRDEPSVEQLLSSAEPWDAEVKNGSRSGRVGSTAMNRPTSTAQRNDSEASQFEAQLSDEKDLEEALAAAPANLRGLLKRQWEATRLSRNNETAPVDRDGARGNRGTTATTAAASKSPRANRLANEDTEWDRTATATASRENASRAVELSLSDDEAGSDSEPTITSLNDLPAPPKSTRQRQVAQTEPRDTHVADDVLMVPSNKLAKANAALAEQATTRSKDNPVAPASAESDSKVKNNVEQAYASQATKAKDLETVTTALASSEASASGSSTGSAPQLGWRDHVREAIRLMNEEQAKTTAPSPAQKLSYAANARFLSMAIGDVDKAAEPIEGLQSHEQEYFRHQFIALRDATDPNGNPVLSRRWTLALENQRKASSHLAAVSNLEVRNAAFCTEVDSYGVINKFSNAHFRPNQELLLYCELDNFASEQVKDGFETQLQGSYEIVDQSGRRVADQLLPVDSHVCRNQRRDYFIAYRIYMPPQIAPGRYQLNLTIEDMKGHKFGQSSLAFQVVP